MGDLDNRQAAHRQGPGYIVLNHSSDDLVIRILENHANYIANGTQVGLIGSIHSSYQHTPTPRCKQGIAVARQRRFTAAVMTQYHDVFSAPYLEAHILQRRQRGNLLIDGRASFSYSHSLALLIGISIGDVLDIDEGKVVHVFASCPLIPCRRTSLIRERVNQ